MVDGMPRREPGTHARDPLRRHAEHNAITDQAAQLVQQPCALISMFIARNNGCQCSDCTWLRSALAVLREVARG
jgi:hypothetical protein